MLGWDPVDQTTGFQRPPLWQRAWVVQERLLSTRILQFSDMQLSWKCRAEDASERLPEGTTRHIKHAGDNILGQALLGLKKFPFAKMNTQTPSNEPSSEASTNCGTSTELIELYNAWYDLVLLYGKCHLSKEADIFPAISGIATAIARAIEDRYLAGLWDHDLHRGLLWTAPDSTKSKTDFRHYRAPSWSWATLNGTCTFHVREIVQKGVDTGVFEIDGAEVTMSGLNRFGQVTEGELKITGLLKRAHPKGLEDEKVFAEMSHGRDRETLFDLAQGDAVGYYYPDNDNRKHLSQIWCSPLMTEESSFAVLDDGEEESRKPRIEARCLALYPLDEAECIYMRVGITWITDFSWFNDCSKSSFRII
jgi:hypothetical protein